MKYNLIKDGIPTDRIQNFDSVPDDVSHKGFAWLEFIDNRNPAHDHLTHKLGSVEKAVVGNQSVWSRPVIAMTAQELSEVAKNTLSQTDADMPRIAEDLYEFIVNGTPIPQKVHDKIARRRALRGKI